MPALFLEWMQGKEKTAHMLDTFMMEIMMRNASLRLTARVIPLLCYKLGMYMGMWWDSCRLSETVETSCTFAALDTPGPSSFTTGSHSPECLAGIV